MVTIYMFFALAIASFVALLWITISSDTLKEIVDIDRYYHNYTHIDVSKIKLSSDDSHEVRLAIMRVKMMQQDLKHLGYINNHKDLV